MRRRPSLRAIALATLAATLLVGAGHERARAQGAAPKPAAKGAAQPPAQAQASAQSGGITGTPNALQGFSQNRDKPIQIDAASLEVRDKDKVATFSGDVKVIQGDTTMRSKVLVVFYDQDTPAGAKGGAGKSAKSAAPGPTGSSQIRRLEAKGNVIVTQKDQTVTGESGVFDMRANTVTMAGGVVLTTGENILRGERLSVDLTTGVSRVDPGKGGRVQGLFKQKSQGPDAGPARPNPLGGLSSPLGR
jgi:lipopolysaccharide export system protein LptA